MTKSIADRQRSAETAALFFLSLRNGISPGEVGATRLLELCHLADLIRTHTDQLDPATDGQEAIDAGVLCALQAFTAEF